MGMFRVVEILCYFNQREQREERLGCRNEEGATPPAALDPHGQRRWTCRYLRAHSEAPQRFGQPLQPHWAC